MGHEPVPGVLVIRVLLAVCALGWSSVASAGARYTEVAKPHYGRILDKKPVFASARTLPSTVLASREGFATAVLTQTDPTTTAYDQAHAHIEVTGRHIPPLHIELTFFRSVSVSWVTSRILLITRDAGHVAGIEELIDVVDRRWLSQHGVSYLDE